MITNEDYEVAQVLFADAFDLVEKAWAAGVDQSAEIRTSSPGLLARGLPQCIGLDASTTPDVVVALEDAALAMARDVYAAAAPDHHHGAAAARAAFAPLHIPLLKAAGLRDADFDAPIVVARVTDGSNENNRYYGVLAELLDTNDKLRILEVPAHMLPSLAESAPPAPPLRLRLKALNTAIFRYKTRLWLDRLKRRPDRGPILILRENELVRETAASLARRGYPLGVLTIPASEVVDDAPGARLREAATAIAINRLVPILGPRRTQALATVFSRQIAVNSARYRGLLNPWRRALRDLPTLPTALLSNFTSDVAMISMHKAATEAGVPVAIFQHGVTMEIHERAWRSHFIHENVAADLAIAFNTAAVEALERNPFGIAKNVSVGLPQDYFRVRKTRRAKTKEIWYISTSLYMGNQGLLYTGVNDSEKAAFEIKIISHILSKIPYPVIYKPYPGIRYIDEDPIVKEASKHPNITINRSRVDLRYIIDSARVVITARSYSTPSWCLMTGKPLAHIDIPNQAQLRPDAYTAFDEGVFLFDARDAEFHDKMRGFLSQPLDAIDAAYAAKSDARRRMIELYFSSFQDQKATAGERAADAIECFVAEARTA